MDQVKRFMWPLAFGGGALLLVIIGMLAWIVPEGHKVSSANAQNVTLQAQETSLQLQIAELRHESQQEPKNCSTLRQDETLVPQSPTVDLFLHQISQLATNAGTATPSVTITSSSGTSAPSSGPSVPGAAAVGIGLSVSGTYPQVLNFMNGLDNEHSLQRLYSVGSVNLTGGGQSSSSSSAVTYSLTLQGEIYYSTAQGDACSTAKSNPASSST